MRKRRKRRAPSEKFYLNCLKLRGLAKALFRIKVYGTENIPESGRLVLCCNHLNLIDPVMLAFSFNRPINFIAKKQLFSKPILGKLLIKLGCIPVDRENADFEMFRMAAAVLEAERPVGIFPEGRRGNGEIMAEGKAGIGMISMRSCAPILPAAIWYPKKAGLFRRTIISFGKVIPFEEIDALAGDEARIVRYQACAELAMKHVASLLEGISG